MTKDIPGYEDIYTISVKGEIYSAYRKQRIRGWIEATGYRAVSLWKEGKAKRVCVHVLLAQCFIPNPDNYPEVNHIDGNKLNNEISNLEWVRGVDNIRHAFSTGLTKHKPCVDYSKIPDLLDDFILGIPLTELCNREKIKQSSTLRKLLHRESVRQGREHEFQEGAKKARKVLIKKQSHRVIQSTPSGKLITEFDSINAASRHIGCNPASIFKAISKNKLYQGYLWSKVNA